MQLKGTKGKKTRAFSVEELAALYNRFEDERIKKARALIGDKPIKPDHFVKFVVERTKLCPHKLFDPLTYYWLETCSLLDGETSLTLPGPFSGIQASFFEAVSLIRHARAQARKEDQKT